MSRAYPDKPIAGVGVVVLKGDKVLLVRRGKPPRAGEWSLPGGAQEIGETVREAAIREVREETGIEIADIHLLDVVDLIMPDKDGNPQFHYTLIDFAAVQDGGNLRAADDAADARWFPAAEAMNIVTWSETKRMIGLAVDRGGAGA